MLTLAERNAAYLKYDAERKARRGQLPTRRVAPPPPQPRAIITDDIKFAQSSDTFSVGDEAVRHITGSGPQIDLGDVHDKSFRGLYDPTMPTKRNYSPHKPIVVEYSDRLIDGVPYYWHATTRVWSTRPPKSKSKIAAPILGRKRK